MKCHIYEDAKGTQLCRLKAENALLEFFPLHFTRNDTEQNKFLLT